MTKPEIIGSLRSTYTRVACMVCEEKEIELITMRGGSIVQATRRREEPRR